MARKRPAVFEAQKLEPLLAELQRRNIADEVVEVLLDLPKRTWHRITGGERNLTLPEAYALGSWLDIPVSDLLSQDARARLQVHVDTYRALANAPVYTPVPRRKNGNKSSRKNVPKK